MQWWTRCPSVSASHPRPHFNEAGPAGKTEAPLAESKKQAGLPHIRMMLARGQPVSVKPIDMVVDALFFGVRPTP